MSTCAAAVRPFLSTSHVFSTLCQHVLQRLLQFSALVSYFLHHMNRYRSVCFILHNGLVLPTLCQYVLQRLLHFTALVSYYLHSVNMCCSGYFNFQQWSRITYTVSTCAESVCSFYSTGLVLPTLCQHVLQRLLNFTELVSYYLDYVLMYVAVNTF
jgi:hypothetical protein